jgi:hypothetical protein
MAKVVDDLCSRYETMGSNPSTYKTKRLGALVGA